MNPKEIKLYNRNAPCSVDYFSPHGVLKNKRKWLDDHELYQAIINDGEYKRVVTPVYLKGGDKKTIYMMDAVTGSLYDIPTGRCLTSCNLRMTDFVFKKGLDKKLLAIRTDVNRGML